MIVESEALLLIFVIVPIVVLWALATLHILFRRPDLSPVSKAVWIGIVIIIPTGGVLIYLLFRPSRSSGRPAAEASASFKAIEEVQGLIGRHDAGEIGDDEFARRKAEIFGLV